MFPLIRVLTGYNGRTMKYSTSPWAKFLRAALLVVVLAAQGLAAAHEFTHWNHPAQELCATCSLSSGLDTPIASTAPTLQAPQSVAFSYEYATLQLHCEPPLPYRQRAPPVSL